MAEKIKIFDTTLRDGDQSPDFHFIKDEKLAMARQLTKLGVDVIEAGFAKSSDGDSQAIYDISTEVGKKDGPTICALARTVDADIEAAAKSLEPCYNPRIHTFIATSDIHIERKLRKSRSFVLETTAKAVRKARTYVSDVEFSLEDFSRTDLDYAVSVVSEAIKSGATTINLPDTVGWWTPQESYDSISYVISKIRKQGLDAIFSVHNHNDLGLATANTLQGILAGARQAEVAINGIGERAGNAALEEIAALIFSGKIPGTETSIVTRYIAETSDLCSRFTRPPQANKAITGANAFAHQAGIHQDGMLKSPDTYEIVPPESFGYKSKLVFGPTSGRNALGWKYEQLGIKLGPEQIDRKKKKKKKKKK